MRRKDMCCSVGRDENGSDTDGYCEYKYFFFLGLNSRIEYRCGQYILCRIVIFIIFGSYRFNFEFPDINAVRIITDIKCPDSDTVLPFECLTLSVGRSGIISIPLSSLSVGIFLGSYRAARCRRARPRGDGSLHIEIIPYLTLEELLIPLLALKNFRSSFDYELNFGSSFSTPARFRVKPHGQ
jgi:hypothetical protein